MLLGNAFGEILWDLVNFDEKHLEMGRISLRPNKTISYARSTLDPLTCTVIVAS